MPDLSVIIVSHNQRNALARAIVSARRWAGSLQVQTIVVDNASTDGSAQMVHRLYSNVQLIANAADHGHARAVSQALETATGRNVLLLSAQAELTAGCLERLLHAFESHPEIGACSPRLSEDPAEVSAGVFPRLALSLRPAVARRRRTRRLAAAFYRNRECYDVDWLPATCLMVRGEVLRQIGGPDDRLRVALDDMEWCARMRRASWRRVVVPAACCLYRPSPPPSDPGYELALLRDEYTYWRLHKPWPATWLLYHARSLRSWLTWSHLVVANLFARNQDPELKAALRRAAAQLAWHVRCALRTLYAPPGA